MTRCSRRWPNRLARTYAAQMDTLKRYRSSGQQKVTVEHVHVHAGGQAIVGNVEAGAPLRKEEAASEVQALPAPDPSRVVVPMTRAGTPLPMAAINGRTQTT